MGCTTEYAPPMKWLTLAVVALLAWAGAILLLQRSVLFPRHAISPPGTPPEGGERWWIDTDAGRTEALFLPGHGTSADKPGPLVVFTHGNAELIDYWIDGMAPYRRAGVNVLLPEYRGYGRSDGRPSQRALASDASAFLERALARPEVDPERLVLHGRSLGGGVVCDLAKGHPPAAMVLQSTFESVASMAWQTLLVPRFLILDPMDNLAAARALNAPLLVIHGRHDEVIPFPHGQSLAAAARDGRLIEKDSGHNDMPMDSTYWNEVLGFLREQGVLELD